MKAIRFICPNFEIAKIKSPDAEFLNRISAPLKNDHNELVVRILLVLATRVVP